MLSLKTLTVWAACIVALLLTSCAPFRANLADTSWVLTALHGQAPIEGSRVTLSFDRTSVEGSGGCNRYSGSYTAAEDALSVLEISATEMGCMEPAGVLEQEQAYLQALNAAASYRIEDARLRVLDNAGTTVLTFIALQQSE